MAKTASPASGVRIEIAKEAVGLLMLLGALFLFVALITYDPADLGAGVWPANVVVHNKGGAMGALLAESLYRYLGLAAYAAVAITGAWGSAIFFRQSVHALVVKGIAAILTLYATAVLLALQPFVTPATLGLEGVMMSLGGAYGEIGSRLLTRLLGPWGTLLAVLFAYGAAMVLATPWMPHQIVKALWRAACVVGVWFASTGWPAMKSAALAFYRLIRPAPGATPAAAPVPAGAVPAAKPASAAPRQMPVPMEPPPSAVRPAPERREAAPSVRAAAPAPSKADEPPGKPAPRPAPIQTPAAVVPEPVAEMKAPRAREAAAPKAPAQFPLPPLDLFEDAKARNPLVEEVDTQGTAQKIADTLAQFDIPVNVTGFQRGPIITEYYIEPAPGIKINRIFGMHDELALALRTPSVRIWGPVPNKGALAIEVPNPCPDIVRMRSLLQQSADKWQHMPLPLLLGKNAAGQAILKSLTEMPHLLVAGTTGSGKSVCLNTIITSLLVSTPPTHLKLLLVDPKMVELSAYKGIPHLWAPVMTDMKHQVPTVLEWLCNEMDKRYDLLSKVECKDVTLFNRLSPAEILKRLERTGQPIPDPLPDHMPYIVCVIDEFGELMNVAAKEVTLFIQRLAQKARAVGIHVVLATQHPSTTVVSPEIKANFPARIAFQVSSQVNSRVVLDRNGAERLLGRGDMLVIFPGMADPIRGQGTYLEEKEVMSVVDYLRKQGEPQYHAELLDATQPDASLDDEPISDELFDQAVRVILGCQRGSVSLLQRKMSIGYSRAARLVDMMAERGIVGGYQGSKAREVLMTLEQWDGLKAGSAEPAGAAQA